MSVEKLTLDQHFDKCISELYIGKELCRYSDSDCFYKLIFNEKHFSLFIKLKDERIEIDWSSTMYYYRSFGSVDEFWNHLTRNEYWFRIYKAEKFGYGTDQILSKKIIEFSNEFMKSEFLTSDYWLLRTWVRSACSESIKISDYKQYCPNCKLVTFWNARYPKHLCGECLELIFDEQGRKVEFSKPEEYNSTIYYLNNIAYFAEEAPMGGIVVQLKE